MNKVNLIPFESNSWSSLVTLDVEAERTESIVSLRYLLNGNIENIRFPEKLKNAPRAEHLWEHTCFEGFFALNSSKSYWEMNLSPSGAWNLYSFDDYRKGQKPEERIRVIQKDFKVLTTEAEMKVVIDLKNILPPKADRHPELSLGLTTVLESKTGEKTYWAIQHLGSKPDFHIRHSFLVTL